VSIFPPQLRWKNRQNLKFVFLTVFDEYLMNSGVNHCFYTIFQYLR